MTKTKAYPISKSQIKQMWAISKAVGMDKEDLYSLCEVDSLHELNYQSANQVIARLRSFQTDKKQTKEHNEVAGMVTAAQQTKIWALMYALAKQNNKHADKTIGERLCAIIKKELGIIAKVESPFAWIDFDDGHKLIEALKRYVRYQGGANA